MKKIVKRLLIVLLFIITFIAAELLLCPWILIGTALYTIRYIITGRYNGMLIYTVGFLTIPIIAFNVIGDDYNKPNQYKDLIMNEIKEVYTEA